MAAAGIASAFWLLELPAGAGHANGAVLVPDMERLIASLREDLAVMARPVLESTAHDAKPYLRVQHWLNQLAAMKGEKIDNAGLDSLTQGKRGEGDSVHLLIMDLHKQINQLAKTLASEVIDGAHVWQLSDADRGLVSAFMRGLSRTAPLKFNRAWTPLPSGMAHVCCY